jgi:hypothetical protein
MKHTREQLDGMSKLELNKTLLTAADVQHYEQESKIYYGVKHDGDNVVSIFTEFDYEKWQDTMPLAVEYGISIIQSEVNKEMNNWCACHEVVQLHGEFECGLSFCTSNPQRAIACCLIMVLESKND